MIAKRLAIAGAFIWPAKYFCRLPLNDVSNGRYPVSLLYNIAKTRKHLHRLILTGIKFLQFSWEVILNTQRNASFFVPVLFFPGSPILNSSFSPVFIIWDIVTPDFKFNLLCKSVICSSFPLLYSSAYCLRRNPNETSSKQLSSRST